MGELGELLRPGRGEGVVLQGGPVGVKEVQTEGLGGEAV